MPHLLRGLLGKLLLLLFKIDFEFIIGSEILTKINNRYLYLGSQPPSSTFIIALNECLVWIFDKQVWNLTKENVSINILINCGKKIGSFTGNFNVFAAASSLREGPTRIKSMLEIKMTSSLISQKIKVGRKMMELMLMEFFMKVLKRF